MSEFRPVSICAEDLEDMEDAGKRLIRYHETSPGLRLLGLALKFREQTGFRAADQVFMCDVDESAGMAEAEVVDLLGYSRKAPCS